MLAVVVAPFGTFRLLCAKGEGSVASRPPPITRLKRLISLLPEHSRTMFHGWEDFFIVGATAGATLIGLLFVAITLSAGSSTPQGLNATRTFVTPTLIRFSTVLFECMALLPPWPSAWPVGIILGLLGLSDLIYQTQIVLKLRKDHIGTLDRADWTFFSVVPILGAASLIAGAGGVIAEKPFAPYAVAGAITLLLLAGIYGAWAITLWIARSLDSRTGARAATDDRKD